MTLRSALYIGHVSHRRLHPKRHALRHRVYWLLADLSELSDLDAKLRFFSHNRTNLVSLLDRDHGDGSGAPLYDQAMAHLRSAGIDENDISIQLLCMPRVFGYDFNPLSVYFCKNRDGRLLATIYEVSNTFGGRHSYVIAADAAPGKVVRQACAKTFYVSPFMDLDLTYRFRTRAPVSEGIGDRVSVVVQALKENKPVINTCLIGERRELSDRSLLRLMATHPALPHKVTGAIYWHALKMWWRGFTINPAAPSRVKTVSIVPPGQ